MGEEYAKWEKKKVFERPRVCVCARVRSSRVSPCPLRICTCNRWGVYCVLVCVYERKGEREKEAKSSGSNPPRSTLFLFILFFPLLVALINTVAYTKYRYFLRRITRKIKTNDIEKYIYIHKNIYIFIF